MNVIGSEDRLQLTMHQADLVGKVSGHHRVLWLEAASLDQSFPHLDHLRNIEMALITALFWTFGALHDDSIQAKLLQKLPGGLCIPAGIARIEQGCAALV